MLQSHVAAPQSADLDLSSLSSPPPLVPAGLAPRQPIQPETENWDDDFAEQASSPTLDARRTPERPRVGTRRRQASTSSPVSFSWTESDDGEDDPMTGGTEGEEGLDEWGDPLPPRSSPSRGHPSPSKTAATTATPGLSSTMEGIVPFSSSSSSSSTPIPSSQQQHATAASGQSQTFLSLGAPYLGGSPVTPRARPRLGSPATSYDSDRSSIKANSAVHPLYRSSSSSLTRRSPGAEGGLVGFPSTHPSPPHGLDAGPSSTKPRRRVRKRSRVGEASTAGGGPGSSGSPGLLSSDDEPNSGWHSSSATPGATGAGVSTLSDPPKPLLARGFHRLQKRLSSASRPRPIDGIASSLAGESAHSSPPSGIAAVALSSHLPSAISPAGFPSPSSDTSDCSPSAAGDSPCRPTSGSPSASFRLPTRSNSTHGGSPSTAKTTRQSAASSSTTTPLPSAAISSASAHKPRPPSMELGVAANPTGSPLSSPSPTAATFQLLSETAERPKGFRIASFGRRSHRPSASVNSIPTKSSSPPSVSSRLPSISGGHARPSSLSTSTVAFSLFPPGGPAHPSESKRNGSGSIVSSGGGDRSPQRRNSSGDLKMPSYSSGSELKIPSFVTDKSKSARVNASQLREFSSKVPDLRNLITTYTSLRASFGSLPAPVSLDTSPESGSSSTAASALWGSNSREAKLADIDQRYGHVWEMAEVLMEVAGRSGVVGGGGDEKESRSRSHGRVLSSSIARERAITLTPGLEIAGSSPSASSSASPSTAAAFSFSSSTLASTTPPPPDRRRSAIVPPSTPTSKGATVGPPQASPQRFRATTGRKEFSKRQVDILRGMMNGPPSESQPPPLPRQTHSTVILPSSSATAAVSSLSAASSPVPRSKVIIDGLPGATPRTSFTLSSVAPSAASFSPAPPTTSDPSTSANFPKSTEPQQQQSSSSSHHQARRSSRAASGVKGIKDFLRALRLDLAPGSPAMPLQSTQTDEGSNSNSTIGRSGVDPPSSDGKRQQQALGVSSTSSFSAFCPSPPSPPLPSSAGEPSFSVATRKSPRRPSLASIFRFGGSSSSGGAGGIGFGVGGGLQGTSSGWPGAAKARSSKGSQAGSEARSSADTIDREWDRMSIDEDEVEAFERAPSRFSIRSGGGAGGGRPGSPRSRIKSTPIPPSSLSGGGPPSSAGDTRTVRGTTTTSMPRRQPSHPLPPPPPNPPSGSVSSSLDPDKMSLKSAPATSETPPDWPSSSLTSPAASTLIPSATTAEDVWDAEGRLQLTPQNLGPLLAHLCDLEKRCSECLLELTSLQKGVDIW